jgi:hypothetical protein
MPSGWRTQVQVVLQADKRHAIGVKVCECVHEVLQRPSEAVDLPAQRNVEPPLVCIGHQTVEFRAGLLRAGDSSIHVFPPDKPTEALAIFSKLPKLHFRILTFVSSRDPSVESDSHRVCGDVHAVSPFVDSATPLSESTSPQSSILS